MTRHQCVATYASHCLHQDLCSTLPRNLSGQTELYIVAIYMGTWSFMISQRIPMCILHNRMRGKSCSTHDEHSGLGDRTDRVAQTKLGRCGQFPCCFRNVRIAMVSRSSSGMHSEEGLHKEASVHLYRRHIREKLSIIRGCSIP